MILTCCLPDSECGSGGASWRCTVSWRIYHTAKTERALQQYTEVHKSMCAVTFFCFYWAGWEGKTSIVQEWESSSKIRLIKFNFKLKPILINMLEKSYRFVYSSSTYLVTHVRFLGAVGLHVLGQSLLHWVNPVTHRAEKLRHLRCLHE